MAFYSLTRPEGDLYVAHPDGTSMRQLTGDPAVDRVPRWSPDGSRIATFGDPATSTGFWSFDPRGAWKQQKPAHHAKPLGDAANRFFVNSWSPDGTRLVGEVQGKASGVLMYTLATGAYDQLTDFGEWPVWLPDGRHVLFVAGGRGFHLLDTRTKAVKRVYTVTRDVIGPPRLSRDAKAMYFSRRVTEADVWLATLK